MGLLSRHIQQQREDHGPDVVLPDSGLTFADVNPLSSDSELGDLLDETDEQCDPSEVSPS